MSEHKQQHSHYALVFLLSSLTLFSLIRPALLWQLIIPICILLLLLEQYLQNHSQEAEELSLSEIQSMAETAYDANLKALQAAVEAACAESANPAMAGTAPVAREISEAQRTHDQIEDHLHKYLRDKPLPTLHGIPATPLSARLRRMAQKPSH